MTGGSSCAFYLGVVACGLAALSPGAQGHSTAPIHSASTSSHMGAAPRLAFSGLCTPNVAGPLVTGARCPAAKLRGATAAGALRMGLWGGGDPLTTYGDVFRQVENLELEIHSDYVWKKAMEPSTQAVNVDEDSEEESAKEVKKRGVIPAIGSVGKGVVAALNRLWSGPDSEEVQRNLSLFAASHPGVALAFEPRPTKRVADIDRLERAFEKALDLDDIEN